MQLGLTFRAAEGLVRFLAYLSLADALGHRHSTGRTKNWTGMLRNPGLGKLLALLTSTAKANRGRSDLAVPEIPNLMESDWLSSVEHIRDVRNQVTHDVFAVRPARAEQLLRSLSRALDAMEERIRWLGEYRLGVMEVGQSPSGPQSLFWYSHMGLHEFTTPRTFEFSPSVPVGEPLLVAPSGTALRLHPLIQVLPVPQLEHEPRMLWLQRIHDPPREMATYLHPVHDQWRVDLDTAFLLPQRPRTLVLPFPASQVTGGTIVPLEGEAPAQPDVQAKRRPSARKSRAIVGVVAGGVGTVCLLGALTLRGEHSDAEGASSSSEEQLSEVVARDLVDKCWARAFESDRFEMLESCLSADFSQTCQGSAYCCGKSNKPLGRDPFLRFYRTVFDRPGRVSVTIEGVASTKIDDRTVQVTLQQYWDDGVKGCQAGARQFTVRAAPNGPEISAMSKLPCRRVRETDADFEKCRR